MKPTRLSAALLLAAALPAAAAPVYECLLEGRRVYTQNPGSHCRKADIGRAGLYSSAAAPQTQTAAPATEAAAPTPETPSRQTARQALEQAEKALAEGRQVRYGNERNYARYQQRIQSLEAAVSDARRRLDASDSAQAENGRDAAPK